MISKSNYTSWPNLALLLFPLLFNWQILQKIKLQSLKLKEFHLGIWQYIFGTLTVIYALILISTSFSLLIITNHNYIGLFFGVKDMLFALTISMHFILSIRLKNSLGKIKQFNP
ncbi:hypothetical protein AQF98_03125 [Pedobacter sp. Hv1]|nr:hypothetical protein AQF98_03125 [Pedobacter sp. Hv1]